MELSNAGFIVIADAEMDAKEDGEDKKEEDKKNDGNKDVPATSLERKKGKERTPEQQHKGRRKRMRRKETAKPTTEVNHHWAFQ